jgi:hypothetical protein
VTARGVTLDRIFAVLLAGVILVRVAIEEALEARAERSPANRDSGFIADDD